jgi:hypothetical protein
MPDNEPDTDTAVRRRRPAASRRASANAAVATASEDAAAAADSPSGRAPGASPTAGEQTPEEIARAAQLTERKRSMFVRIGVIVVLVLLNYKPNQPASTPANADSSIGATASAGATASTRNEIPESPAKPSVWDHFAPMAAGAVPPYYQLVLRNGWKPHTPCELRVFLSETSDLTLSQVRAFQLNPVWELRGLSYDWNTTNYHSQNITVPVPDAVRSANASWYLHAFLATDDIWRAKDDLEVESLSRDAAPLYRKHNIVRWTKKSPDGKNLLGGESNEGEDKSTDDVLDEGALEMPELGAIKARGENEIVLEQMWKPAVPMEVLFNADNVMLSKMPVNVAREFSVNVETLLYYPPLAVNEFWILRDHLRHMNSSVSEVSLEFSFKPVSMNMFTMIKSVEGMWASQMQMGAMRENEPDQLKRIFVETNPVLLGTTVLVSVAHSVLEALAFRSDITHWKNIKTLEGVSVRTMFWQIAMQLVIFLYLWDNETSWMITIGNGFGIFIEVWKLQKAVKVKNFGKKKLFGFIPWFELEHQDSYSKQTKEYDDDAMRYVGYVLYPCLIMYAVYSLRYEKHKSWYSWVIGSLVGAVYAFGFLMMLPQVIINHKLKSVAHMPMKSFMFKALNTIIDDMFSFIIKMPWLHRLACFRDDVVFLVYLYQYWKYPVDKTRVNEFGQRGEDYLESSNGTGVAETIGESESTSVEESAEDRVVKSSSEKKSD